tara:strand:- start:71792 stop:72346 length:555 start_codon:yes stop_codon:yes gene_type:complete
MIRIAVATVILACTVIPVRAELLIDGMDGTSNVAISDRNFNGVHNQPFESGGLLIGISSLVTGITYEFDGVVDLSLMPAIKLKGLTSTEDLTVSLGINDQSTLTQVFTSSATPADMLFDISGFSGISDVDSLRVTLFSQASGWEGADFSLDAITAVPEPSSLTLVSSALLGCAFGLRRKKSRLC